MEAQGRLIKTAEEGVREAGAAMPRNGDRRQCLRYLLDAATSAPLLAFLAQRLERRKQTTSLYLGGVGTHLSILFCNLITGGFPQCVLHSS